MPAIDLARLRKQANRLADFFFLSDEFMKHLRSILDYYVNYTLRTRENVAPGSNLKTYHTPQAVLTQIENSLREVAEQNPHFALELADVLWEEGALETRLLAAFLLGRITPQEEKLLPRLSAWTQQVRDPQVRTALLSTSLDRMRRESPQEFLGLIREYLHPARPRSWADGLQALLPMVSDLGYSNLPPILDIIEPVIREAPSTLQNELRDILIALYRASASETTYMLKNLLADSQNPMTAIILRRISPDFPAALQDELREILRFGTRTGISATTGDLPDTRKPQPASAIADTRPVSMSPQAVKSKRIKSKKSKTANPKKSTAENLE